MSDRRTVAIWTLPETGHLNPTLRLADTLVSRGHRVVYVAPAMIRPTIEAAGHEVTGWFDELYDEAWQSRISGGGTLDRRRAITERYARIAAELGRRGAAPILGDIAPDVLVADVQEPLLALVAARDGLPIVVMNTSLPQTRDPGVPPTRGSVGLQAEGHRRLDPRLAWWVFRSKRTASALAARALRAEPPYASTTRFARSLGLARGTLDPWTVYYPQLDDRPELVLCPAAFDVERAPRPLRYYVESERRGSVPPLPDGLLPPGDGPLVYCSLGTRAYRTDRTPTLFRAVLDAVAAHPERRLVLSLGQHLTPDQLGTLPANVTAHRSVPQLALLGHAAAMVTHGGLGTVKECVLAGVPMVVVPLSHDQHANAALVERHGLGSVADLDTLTRASIERQLDDLLTSSAVGGAIATMQQRFRAVEDDDLGADVVAAVAAGAALPPNPGRR